MGNFLHRLAMILSLLAVAVSMIPTPAKALGAVAGAPDGFEQLAAARPSVVTLYYGGDVLGNFTTHVTPQTIQFDDPDAVIATIPAIRDVDKATIKTILGSPMPTHPDQLCTSKRVENCGKLIPEKVGIIFNEARLTGELFFNSSLLTVADNTGTRYLPVPKNNDLSSVSSFSGAVNGVDTNTPNYTITNNSTFAMGDKKLNTQTTMTNRGLRFDTASAGFEREGVSAEAGLLQSRPMELISDRDIVGVSVSSSQRTLLDAHKAEGNSIILFLPRQSFVSIYREGRLYSSRSYEAGNQQIDTSELPSGAYDITLRIQDSDGSTREEKRFFAKSLDLPPPGQPMYYAQAGVIRAPASSDSTLPQLTSNPLLRVGTIRRIDDNTGLNASVLGLSDRAITEVGAFWINEDIQARATALGSTKGDLGATGSLFYTQQKMSAAIDIRQLWLSDSPMPGYSDITNSFTQFTATGNYIISEDLTLGLRASYSKQGNMQSSTSFGPYADWRIWQEGERMLSLSANAARTDGENQGNILLSFTYRLGENGVSSSLGSGYGKDSKGGFGTARGWHDEQDASGNGLTVGAGVTGDDTNRTVGGDVDWRNQLAQLRGSVQQGIGQTSTTTYGGSFNINAAQVEDEVHVGGAQQDGSAVVIDAAGDTDATMKIFVNNMQRSTVKVGDKQVIYLSPFHNYNIRLAPSENALLDFDSADRKITMYPGNVIKLHWDVRKFYVVTAKILYDNGAPLANATLQDSRDQVVTSETGRLQAEMVAPKTLRFITADNSQCVVELPASVTAKKGVLIYPQPLTCKKVSQNDVQH